MFSAGCWIQQHAQLRELWQLWLFSLMPGPVFLLSSSLNRNVLYVHAWCLHGVLVLAYLYELSCSYYDDQVHLFLVGAICNCLLPESLKISPVGHDPNSQSEDSEKRRLRNPFSCFSSISSHRQLPSSSPFPPSPVKEGLSHCSSRKPSTASLKNR